MHLRLAPLVADRLAARLDPRGGVHVAEALAEQRDDLLVEPVDAVADLGHGRQLRRGLF